MPGANPYSLAGVLQNPLARMLPLRLWQQQVYRLGERMPPGLKGLAPIWECVTLAIGAQATLQARINVQRDWHLLALRGSQSEAAGPLGFRYQLYDLKKERPIFDRGIKNTNMAGQAFFLREPYPFDQPDSQILVMVQSFATAATTVQIVLYGVAERFNAPGGMSWPGGPIASGG